LPEKISRVAWEKVTRLFFSTGLALVAEFIHETQKREGFQNLLKGGGIIKKAYLAGWRKKKYTHYSRIEEETVMRNKTQYVRMARLTGLVIVLSLLMAGASFAGSIVAVHGHSGDIEYMDHVASTDRLKVGWGLDFEQNPGTWNWLQYSIPTTPLTKTRYLLVRFETGITGETADSVITQFHVFDGETRIYQQSSLNLTGGPQYALIDMGEDKTIEWALGLSIEVAAGVESMSHRIRIYAVWAEWH